MSTPVATEIIWTTRDTLYAIGIIISLTFSIISTVIALISLSNTKKRDLNIFGDSEAKTFESINKAESDFESFNSDILEKKNAFETDPKNNGKKFTLSKFQEDHFQVKACDVLNAYDIACQRYRDGKLDKIRFGKTYSDRIRTICSNPIYKPIIYDGSHKYSAIRKVNKELNDKEK